MFSVESYQKQLSQLCAIHKVKELYLFGSGLTNKFDPQSDVDLLVQFIFMDVKDYFDNYMGLKEQLEELFERPVDLVENQAIRNPIFRKVVDRDKKLIYERKDIQVAL